MFSSLAKMGREPEPEEPSDGELFGDEFFIEKKSFK